MGLSVEDIQQTISSIIREPLFSVFSLFVGFVISHVYYRRSLRDRSPFATKTSRPIIRKTGLDKLEISYAGKRVDEVSLSTCSFWNEGKVPICQEDFAEGHKLSVVAAQGVTILSCLIERQSCEYNACQIVEVDPGKNYLIVFSHFDQEQGVRLQVLHDGSHANGVFLNGVVKGIGPIKEGREDLNYAPRRRGVVWTFILAVIFIGLLWSFGKSKAAPDRYWTLAVLMGLMMLLDFVETFSFRAKTPPRSLLGASRLKMGPLAKFANYVWRS